MLTARLTGFKTEKQSYNTSDKAKESNEIELGKFFPNWTSLPWIKIEESKKNNCRNTAGGSGDDRVLKIKKQTSGGDIQVDEETPPLRDVFCKCL